MLKDLTAEVRDARPFFMQNQTPKNRMHPPELRIRNETSKVSQNQDLSCKHSRLFRQQMGVDEIRNYLSHLATDKKRDAS